MILGQKHGCGLHTRWKPGLLGCCVEACADCDGCLQMISQCKGLYSMPGIWMVAPLKLASLRSSLVLLRARACVNLPRTIQYAEKAIQRWECGLQTFTSRRDDDTSLEGTHRAPIWEQEFQFLVEDFKSQVRSSQSAALHADCAMQKCLTFACMHHGEQIMMLSGSAKPTQQSADASPRVA